MQRLARRWTFLTIIVLLALVVAFHSLPQLWKKSGQSPIDQLLRPGIFRTKFIWKNLHQQHPVWNLSKLPTGPVANVPKVQADFQFESDRDKSERKRRLAAVEEAFLHSWEGYKSHAWLHDEVGPLSGQSSNEFGGWGATLVDSLDTLWIMDMKREFAFAVSDLKKIDFTTTDLDTLNVFETTIRYLGGLLSAYDISGHKYKILLQKAIELGDMLYMAFDTPNRMPVTRWDWKNAAIGEQQEADTHALLAEVGSMTLEFTRLSQITGDNKWYDAITRVTDATHERQNDTKIPGLWPTLINMRILDFKRGTTFTFGGMADSLYEYLPKQYLMLGGNNNQYHDMYLAALESAKEHLFFIPLNRQNENMLLTGTLERKAAGDLDFIPQAQHLSCFAGGMVALAAKVFDATNEIDTARQLVDGCLWAYESMPSGIMPEIFTAVPCDKQIHQDCRWSEDHWHNAVSAHVHKRDSDHQRSNESAQRAIMQNNLPPGIVEIADPRYNLRPEAIESLFVLYRITGDKALQDRAWKMFESISNATKTDIAYASIVDVTEQRPALIDSMESFWTAETLKYFYLIFSEPDVISLDDYVFNTEAHPLLRPK